MSGRRLAATAAVLGVAAAVFVRVHSRPLDGAPPAAELGDLVTLYYPMLRYAAAEVAAGRLPLWNPYQSCGEPLLANPGLTLFYPLYLPLLVLPTDVALRLDLVLHLTIAGAGVAALAWYGGGGLAAGLIGGLIYGFAGGMLFKANYPGFLPGVAWLPWLLLAVLCLIDAPSRRRLVAAAASAALLACGNPQFVYFAVLLLLPLAGAAWWARRGGGLGAPLAALAAALALAVLLTLVRSLPGLEYMRDTWRAGALPLAAVSALAIAPADLLRHLVLADPRPNLISVARNEAYLGVVPLALALVGALGGAPRRLALPLAAGGLGAALYAMGAATPVLPLLARLPGGTAFRGPNRALIITDLAVAV
ncbi:MAG: hypothetical protein SF182_11340, partial [Deltaproteobacteria bacterium]|nr:hypothetical protein [Deltaproteobacteria bacterium]